MNNIYINTKVLFLITLIPIGIIYYFLFPYEKIINIIKEQYIILSIVGVLFFAYLFQSIKLKAFDILHFLPNLNHVSLKSSVLIFLFFMLIDYYSQENIKDMISLWFMYWCFGVLAYLLSLNINLYKNLKFYRNNNIINKKD